MPHDGDELAALRVQRKVVQHGLLRMISEADVLDVHPPLHVGKLHGVVGVRGLGGLLKDAEHPLGSGERGLKLAQNVCDLVDGAGEFARIQHEGGDAAHARDDAVHVQDRTEHADEGEREIVHEVDGRPRDRAVALRLGVGIRRRDVLLLEPCQEGLLAAVGFRRLLPRDDLLDEAVELAQLFGAGAEERLHLVRQPARKECRERHRDREYRDKQRRRDEHHQEGTDDGDDAGEDHHDIVCERFPQRIEIV